MSTSVALVGGGPGARPLVTLRAEALLAAAATVVTDADLVAVVAELAPSAVVHHATGLDATRVVDALLARPGASVRLYVGDPWLHPTHAAEAAELHRRGVPSDSVPGVSTAIGRATASLRPTHHRGVGVAAFVEGDRIEVVEVVRG